jgi:hypothetical protein
MENDMYLYVEMFDSWAAFNESNYGCSVPSGCRRIVKIKLTEEQIKQLEPRECGSNGNNIMYESVNPLCIQKEV